MLGLKRRHVSVRISSQRHLHLSTLSQISDLLAWIPRILTLQAALRFDQAKVYTNWLVLEGKLLTRTRSITFKYPYENAIAFGGVATGNMNANDVATTVGKRKYNGWTSKTFACNTKKQFSFAQYYGISKLVLWATQHIFVGNLELVA